MASFDNLLCVLLTYVIKQQRGKTFAFICLLYVQDENQNFLICPILLAFQLLILK